MTLTNWKVIVPVPPKDSVLNTNVHENRVLLTIVLRRVQHVSPITSAPWTRKMPSRSPACPKAAGARGQRPGAGRLRAWGSRGHFGGRCCLGGLDKYFRLRHRILDKKKIVCHIYLALTKLAIRILKYAKIRIY